MIGANPPSTTSGGRTLARVEQARVLLGFDSALVANLFALPSYRSGGVSALGTEPIGWLQARIGMVEALSGADAVLLAFGTQTPTGPARTQFRGQVTWLDRELESSPGLPIWWVGGAPRHPSRWQRYTSRTHPDLPFREALQICLTRREESAGTVSPSP